MSESRPSKEFEREVIAFMPKLKAFAYGLAKDSGRADDLVQETVMKALAHHQSFKPGTKLNAWLFTICRNEFYNTHRKRKREVEDVDGVFSSNLADEAALPDAGVAEEFAEVMSRLDGLHPDVKALVLDIANGMSYAEAARKYEIEEGTAKSRVNRAREILISARNDGSAYEEAPIKTALRPITAPVFGRKLKIRTDFGTPPVLNWLPITSLRVDPKYQREILKRGQKNVGEIAEAFDWNKFGTVIVARAGGGIYVIIDGQHRTTAADLCGITHVPCQVIEADLAQQAQAFAAINGNITVLTPIQIHQARIAAGESETIELESVAKRAGVKILRYPVPADKIGPAQTMAVGCLRAAKRTYGSEVLIAALMCLSKTRGGNPGMLRQQIIQALCHIISVSGRPVKDPAWAVEAAGKIRFEKIWLDCQIKAKQERKALRPVLIQALTPFFAEPA